MILDFSLHGRKPTESTELGIVIRNAVPDNYERKAESDTREVEAIVARARREMPVQLEELWLSLDRGAIQDYLRAHPEVHGNTLSEDDIESISENELRKWRRRIGSKVNVDAADKVGFIAYDIGGNNARAIAYTSENEIAFYINLPTDIGAFETAEEYFHISELMGKMAWVGLTIYNMKKEYMQPFLENMVQYERDKSSPEYKQAKAEYDKALREWKYS